MPGRKDIERLIQKHERRLQKLKEARATYGLETPPHILIQIEDIEAELQTLQTELRQLDQKPRPPDSPSPPPPSAPATLKDKLLAIARDPVWQMIGVIIALVTLGWTIFTFFIAPAGPEAATATAVVDVTPTPTSLSPTTTPTDPATFEQVSRPHISLNETVAGTLYFNEGDEWVFSDGPATINVILDVGPYGDALLMLFDPSGVQRQYVDAQTGSEERLENYTIPDNGSYTILVRNTKNEQTDYTLTVESAQTSGRIGLDETVSGTLYFNEGDEWVFSDGPATINVILDVGPRGEALLIVYDSSGVERQYVDAQAGSEERLVNYTIPDTGDYTILVRNTKNEQTDYTLTVEAVSN